MKSVLVICILGLVSFAVASESKRPNIIFFLVDDLGYGEVGVYGQTEIKTPELDKMAGEGMKFTDFYAGSPVCGPSRCNLMTGLHGGHCRLRENDKDYLRDSDLTVAEMLKVAGYTTGLFGKWGLSHNNQPGSFPTNQGFDKFVGYLSQKHAHNFWPTFLLNNTDTIPLGNEVPGNDPYDRGNATVEVDYAPQVMLDSALKFIDDNKEKPFFLYYATNMPHINNEAANQPDAGYELPNGDVGQYASKSWSLGKKSYAAMVTLLDTHMGKMLDTLSSLGIDSNTLVIFTSDNGATWIAKNDGSGSKPIGDWFDSQEGMRGYKGDIFEGGMRVPAIVRWPGVIGKGKTTNAPGTFVDWMPTFANIAGVEVPQNIDGRDLLPVLLETGPVQGALTWYFPRSPNNNRSNNGYQYAVRSGDWKAVWWKNSGGTEQAKLYNMSTGRNEQTDVQGANSAIMSQLTAIRNNQVPNPGVTNSNPVIAQWSGNTATPALQRICEDESDSYYNPNAEFCTSETTSSISRSFEGNGVSFSQGELLFKKELPTQVRVYSASGSLILHQSEVSNSVFSLQGLPVGAYWIQVDFKSGKQFHLHRTVNVN